MFVYEFVFILVLIFVFVSIFVSPTFAKSLSTIEISNCIAFLQTVWEDLLPLILTLLVGNVLIALVAMLSVLCWRKFRNLSFGEQFLDYKVIPTWTENADQSTVCFDRMARLDY